MSRIDKIINIKNEDNLLEGDLPLNQDEKQRILQMTVDKISVNSTKKHKGKKVIISILIATMMISTIAMANEYFVLNLDNRLLNYLGIDKSNRSLNGADAYINKTIEDDNLKINIKQSLGDKNSVYILLEVETSKNINIKDKNTLNREMQFEQVDINLDKRSSSGWSISSLADENPNDNKLNFLISYSSDKKINGRKITLDFQDFGYYSDEDGKFVPLVNGNWKVSWKLDYKDVSKEIIVNRTIKINDNKYFITSVNISPICASANLISRNRDNINIEKVTLKDGTQYTGGDFISGGTSSSLLKISTRIGFSKVIDVSQVKSITIGNKTVELEN